MAKDNKLLLANQGKKVYLRNISTSETEIKDILKAWVAISIAFAIVMGNSVFTSSFYIKFIIASLTVGVGFLFHELGHKLVAQRYGCFAEFRSFDNMLLLAIAMSFFGFIFAAPGAVMISGRITNKKNGKISAAGPLVNLVMATIFLAFIFINVPKLFKEIAFYGFVINSWLGLFNMIPFWLFDGFKILKWNKPAYFGMLAVALIFMILQNFVAPV